MGMIGKVGSKRPFRVHDFLRTIQYFLATRKRRVGIKIKRSSRDPFLYLGIFTSALLIIVSVTAGPILQPLSSERDFVFLTRVSAGATQFFLKDPVVSALNAPSAKKESFEIVLMQNNSIVASVVPPGTPKTQALGTLDESFDSGISARQDVVEYTVEPGESLQSLADKFGISIETIVWANGLTLKAKLKAGQKLIILPVSGVLHYVQKGESVGSIAKTYKADSDKILSFNDLSGEGDIYRGDILIIPEGVMPALAKKSTPINSATRFYGGVPVASSYFICPLGGACKINQGLHWYNAVDFGGSCGSPVYAAAGGTIQKVKYGWNGGGGNLVTISHPNETSTYYGHLMQISVVVGEQVSQGQIIGFVGGKPGTAGAGISTGCHTHFEVRGAKNPFAY